MTSRSWTTTDGGQHGAGTNSSRRVLRDELEELGISTAELAKRIRVPPNRVSQILACKRNLTADTALRLGRWFGTGPDISLNLQKAYELDLARQKLGDTIDAIAPRDAA